MVKFCYSRLNLGRFLFTIATDGKDWHGLKVFKKWAIFFLLCLQKQTKNAGSLYISGNLSTYPSPKPTFCFKWEVNVNVGLGEGLVGRWFVLAEEIWLISYSYLCKSTLCVVRHKVMTSAQNWPKKAISSWHTPFKTELTFIGGSRHWKW